MYSLQDMLNMFIQINADCEKDGEPVVPFTDVEYYTQQISNIYNTPLQAATMMANWMKDAAPLAVFMPEVATVEVDEFEMIATFKPTGQKVKAKVIVDTDNEVSDQVDALGDVQSSFLWDNFAFEFKKLSTKKQLVSQAVNVYSDVTVITE